MLIELSNKEIKMPIMAFTDKDIFIKNNEQLIMRKSSLSFYSNNNVTIVDSDGKILEIHSIQLNGKMLWWNFFKDGFYDYYNVTIRTKEISKINFEEFKEKIKLFIEQNPKYGWNRIDRTSQIKKAITEAQSFVELISLFHYLKA